MHRSEPTLGWMPAQAIDRANASRPMPRYRVV
jgi:hypothetical protein